MKTSIIFVLILLISLGAFAQNKTEIKSTDYIISPDIPSPHRETLGKVISEEIGKRTGMAVALKQNWSSDHTMIAVVLQDDKKLKGRNIPKDEIEGDLPAEGFALVLQNDVDPNVIWVIGADVRGALYGIGKLLRVADMTEGSIVLPAEIDQVSSPEYSLRGHQLGYRNTANSWDKWTPEQYDQYIRDLAIFGSNAIEDIPFQSTEQSVQMIMPHKDMHPIISQICDNYDLDYWVWTPGGGDLSDELVRQEQLALHEDFYKSIPRLNAIFFPGGDPGDNHPKYVLPHLKNLAEMLHKYHPEAEVWISLQGFEDEKTDYFFDYLAENDPDWLAGVVYGPSSPEIDVERRRLPKKYKHRLYGDITHTVRCSYPTENWDQAYAMTLGREAPNPQPYYYARVFRQDAPFTDGFISYSDGAHDDVNKIVWNQMGWDSNSDVREIMTQYSRFFFGPKVAQSGADGILALEQNWDGSIIANGSIEATKDYWQNLEKTNPQLSDNWRWQLFLVRAYYDAYIRDRLIYEKGLEKQAYRVLERANEIGAQKAMDSATEILNQAETTTIDPELKAKIVNLAERLYKSMGLQSSVPLYQASGYERGAFMDFIDLPLNNRWWLEDEFVKISAMQTEQEKTARLNVLVNWDNPGPGGFYDNISDVSASPHVVSVTDDAIDYAWWDNGRSRKRLSTQLFQFSPILEYTKLDAQANYLIRVSGYGEALLRANGQRLKPIKYDKELESFKEFVLPKELIPDGTLTITFDKPDEAHLNWRKYSKVTEVWLIKEQ
jgi:hypothetical protein